MIDVADFLTENATFIVTALLSLTAAFLVWSIKESYKKHCEEVTFLSRIEIIFTHNLGSLLINESFLKEWIGAMEKPQLYNCSFRTYLYLSNQDYNTTNLKLLNDLIKFNFSLKGLQDDLNIFFKGYHQTSLKLLPENYVQEWQGLNKNTLQQSDKFATSFTQAIDDAKNCIALTRAYAKQKKHTPYGILRFILGKNLLPSISEETIGEYRKEIEDDLREKESLNT